MKNIIKALVLTALVLAAFSCDELDDAEALIEDRIDDFESDLNDGNYDDLSDHFHPDMDSYDSYMDSSIINNGPLSESRKPFKFGSPDISEDGSKYDIDGSFTSDVADGVYEAVMKEDGDDWKILEMTIDIDASVDYEIRTLK